MERSKATEKMSSTEGTNITKAIHTRAPLLKYSSSFDVQPVATQNRPSKFPKDLGVTSEKNTEHLTATPPEGINPILATVSPGTPITPKFGPIPWPYSDSSVQPHTQSPPAQIQPSWTIGKEVRANLQGGLDYFFYIVYKEIGWVGVHTTQGDGNNVDRLLKDDQNARGWFMESFSTSIQPTDPSDPGGRTLPGAVLRNATPETDNTAHTISAQIIAGTSYSATVGCSSEQGASASTTYAQDTQNWSGDSWEIKDFGYSLNEDTSAVRPSWSFFMMSPYSAVTVFSDFPSLWQQAYDSNSNVADLPATAKNGMSYVTYATFGIPDHGAANLPVRFRGKFSVNWVTVATNGYGPTGGHHQCTTQGGEWDWVTDVDVAALWKAEETRANNRL